MPELSILDARLAEIDRRLRMIQSGLEPVPDASFTEIEHTDQLPGSSESDRWRPVGPLRAAPPPPLPLSSPTPGTDDSEIAALTARLRELTAVQERLLTATRDLLVEHAEVLARVIPTLGVCAGPFADTATLQEFQRALGDLPQVRDVMVREYAGAERAVLDVHLWAPIS